MKAAAAKSAPSARDAPARPGSTAKAAGGEWTAEGDAEGDALAATHAGRRRDSPRTIRRSCACGGTCPRCSAPEEVRTKLRVGTAGDAVEREADSLAALALGIGSATPAPDQPARPGADATAPTAPTRRRVSRKARPPRPGTAADTPAPAPRSEADEGAALEAGGFPLPATLRAFFEARFGRDFSRVRLHTGPEAEARNEALHAHAFTFGSHIWLGRGNAPRADFLLAHELAHVIQQSQPGRVAPEVRKLDIGMPFWVPLGAKGMMNGRDLHNEVQGLALKNNSDLDSEAPVPNADRKAHGVGLQGLADLYRGKNGKNFHAKVGLFFDGHPPGSTSLTGDRTTPTRHSRASLAGIAAGRFNPFEDGGKVAGLDLGPETVELGEIKPATKPMLDAADDQVRNYERGFTLARRLAMEWAAANGVAGNWNLKSAGRLPGNAVKLKGMEFEAKNPKADRKLVLAEIKEHNSIANRWTVRKKFNPEEHGLPPIMGGLYAQEFGTGKGLWMYFARPKDLKAALAAARGRNTQALMTLAQQVQEQVVNPIKAPPAQKAAAGAGATTAPKKKAKLAKPGTPPPAPAPRPAPSPGAEGPARTPPGAAASPRAIRRKPKKPIHVPPTLENNFDLKKWTADHKALHQKVHVSPDADTKKTMATLRLLDEAYRAEDAFQKTGVGKSQLPDRKSDMIKFKTSDGKPHEKALGDVGGWIQAWTSAPVEKLGAFRDRFGAVFASVANKMIALIERGRERIRALFKQKTDAKPKGKARVVLAAIAKAVRAVAKIILPHAIRLLMSSIEEGARKKLSTFFDVDPHKILADGFTDTFDALLHPLQEFEAAAETHIQKTLDSFAAEFGWIKKVEDLVSKVGPILEAAAAALQCIPPTWRCLGVLIRPLQNCAIEAIAQDCDIQEEIAGYVAEIGAVQEIPKLLAEKARDALHAAAPDGLKEVFAEPIPDPGKLSIMDSHECTASDSEIGCPRIGLGKAPSEDDLAREDEPPPPPPPEPPKPQPPPPPQEKKEESPPKPEDKGEEEPPAPEDKGEEPDDIDVGPDGEPKPPKPDEPARPEDKGPGGTKPGGGTPGDAPEPPKPEQGGGSGSGTPGPRPKDPQEVPEKAPPPPPSKQPPPKGQHEEGAPGSGGKGPKGGGAPGGDGRPSPKGTPDPAGKGKPMPGTAGGRGGPPNPGGTGKGRIGRQTEGAVDMSRLAGELGKERIEGILRLARKAGMPEDAPFKPEHAKKLRELTKGVTGKDIEDYADGKAGPDVAKKVKPLEDFLGKAAHDAALEKTLENLKQKKYEFKFDEMARNKVHWKILVKYQPGPFKNAPALMWDATIRAAGVVDGRFGPCVNGVVSVTVTRADMHEEGTGQPITVHVPWHDKDAKLKGGVCPPPPAQGGGGQGDPDAEGGGGGGQGEAEKPKDQGGGGKGGEGGGKGGGQEQEPPQGGGGEKGGGGGSGAEGGEGGKSADEGDETDSDVQPGTEGDRMPEPDEEGEEGGKEDEEEGGGDKEGKGPELALDDRFPYCPPGTECGAGAFAVGFEESGSAGAGWEVLPAGFSTDPGRTSSVLNPPNGSSPLSLREREGGGYAIVFDDGAGGRVVGRAVPSSGDTRMVEVKGGPLLRSLRRSLAAFKAEERGADVEPSMRIFIRRPGGSAEEG